MRSDSLRKRRLICENVPFLGYNDMVCCWQNKPHKSVFLKTSKYVTTKCSNRRPRNNRLPETNVFASSQNFPFSMRLIATEARHSFCSNGYLVRYNARVTWGDPYNIQQAACPWGNKPQISLLVCPGDWRCVACFAVVCWALFLTNFQLPWIVRVTYKVCYLLKCGQNIGGGMAGRCPSPEANKCQEVYLLTYFAIVFSQSRNNMNSWEGCRVGWGNWPPRNSGGHLAT